MRPHIKIGWMPHELLWLEAALSLPRVERVEAFESIASMTQRSLSAVRDKAYWLEGELKIKEAWAKLEASRSFPIKHKNARRPVFPSELRQPTKSQLTAGRAR